MSDNQTKTINYQPIAAMIASLTAIAALCNYRLKIDEYYGGDLFFYSVILIASVVVIICIYDIIKIIYRFISHRSTSDNTTSVVIEEDNSKKNIKQPKHPDIVPIHLQQETPSFISLPSIKLTEDGWDNKRLSSPLQSWMDFLSPLTLEQIIVDYPRIELQLRYNLLKRAKQLLCKQGWKLSIFGNDLIYQGIKWNIYFHKYSLLPDSRQVHIMAKPDSISNTVPLTATGPEINAIGSIRYILLDYPHNEINMAEIIIKELNKDVEDAYRALEDTFISKVSQASEALFDDVYLIMEKGLNKMHGNELGQQLLKQCWFALANKKFSAYFYNRETLDTIAERLKHHKRQHLSHSPFHYLSVIVTHAFKFDTTFGKEALSKKKRFDAPWNIARYISTESLVYEAEVALYSSENDTNSSHSDKLSVFSDRLNDEFSWSIACPESVADDVMGVVWKLKMEISRYLTECSAKRWAQHISSVVSRAKSISEIRHNLETPR